jgi:hypothetical protein
MSEEAEGSVNPHEVLNPPANSDVAAARSAALRPLNAYRVQRAERFGYRKLTCVALVKGAVEGSARWTRAGPAQRAVPHPARAVPHPA